MGVVMSLLLDRSVAAVASALITSAVVSCESSKTDGTDLRGVFDRKPVPSAASAVTGSASTGSRAKPKASADAGPRIAPLIRKPPVGPCLPPRGKPVEKLGRIARRPACRRARVLEWRDGNGTGFRC